MCDGAGGSDDALGGAHGARQLAVLYVSCVCVTVQAVVTTHWAVHTARVNSLDWSPDSLHLGSAGLDCSLAVHDPSKITTYNKFPGE